MTRTRRAALALYLLAPVCGELLSGSTPIAAFMNPLTLLFLSGVYGSGAVLIRDVVRSRRLGWWSVPLLGAAYGVLEEGLMVTSWFNPYWPDVVPLGAYGRALDLSWLWAAHLTIFHAVVSMTVPIVLAEALFPDVADSAWLSPVARTRLGMWLGFLSLVGVVGFGFVAFREQGYTHPPASYVFAIGIALALVRVALRLRPQTRVVTGAPPTLARMRWAGFAFITAVFALGWLGPHLISIAALTLAGFGALIAFAGSRVSDWSARAGWGAEHRLALASGALAFLIALQPIVEATHAGGRDAAGQTFVAAAAALFLVWLARRRAAARVALAA
jgi:hypothetical protein